MSLVFGVVICVCGVCVSVCNPWTHREPFGVVQGGQACHIGPTKLGCDREASRDALMCTCMLNLALLLYLCHVNL